MNTFSMLTFSHWTLGGSVSHETCVPTDLSIIRRKQEKQFPSFWLAPSFSNSLDRKRQSRVANPLMGVREMEIANINLTNKSYPAGVFLFFFFPLCQAKKKNIKMFLMSLLRLKYLWGKYAAADKHTERKVKRDGEKIKKTSYCVMSLGNGG